jgi:hypothetical protein
MRAYWAGAELRRHAGRTLGFSVRRRSPRSEGGGLLQRGQEPLSCSIVEDIAGALSLAACRSSYELAEGLASDGCCGLLEIELLLGDSDLAAGCLGGRSGRHRQSVRHESDGSRTLRAQPCRWRRWLGNKTRWREWCRSLHAVRATEEAQDLSGGSSCAWSE